MGFNSGFKGLIYPYHLSYFLQSWQYIVPRFRIQNFSDDIEGARLIRYIKETQSPNGFTRIQLGKEEITLYLWTQHTPVFRTSYHGNIFRLFSFFFQEDFRSTAETVISYWEMQSESQGIILCHESRLTSENRHCKGEADVSVRYYCMYSSALVRVSVQR
jgi:hypothetical protein